MEGINQSLIKQLIEKALDKLYKEDYETLICLNHKQYVGERACVFRFGIYLYQILKRHKQFKEYNLDCEYNRSYDKPKRNNDGKLIIPDIIIHKRGYNDNNLVVIEFKGWWNKDGQDGDRCKLTEMINPNGEFKYRYGYTILFNKVKQGSDRYAIKQVDPNS